MYEWEEDFEEDEGIKAREFGGKNALIFLVDATIGMHAFIQPGETLFQRAMRSICDTFKSKIFTSDQDVLSVVCFGTTQKSPATLDFNHIGEIVPPGRPSKDGIMALESLYADLARERFLKEYGGEGEVKLHEVLWHCQSLLSEVKGKVSTRKILLLTCNENPHSGKQDLDIQARRKAGDLHSNNIYLEVVPVVPPDTQFNLNKFYKDLIRLADDDWTTTSAASIESLTETVLKKTFVKRTTSRLLFNIGGVEVGVATYNMLGRAAKPSKKLLAADTNEEVKSERTWVHPVRQEPLLPSDMARVMHYGGKDIKMSDNEVAQIRSFGEAGNVLTLLGFRPASSLKLGSHVKIPQFLYPCDQLVRGSSSLLHALIVRASQRDKVAICSFKQRSSSGPSYVALLPQEEELEEGQQIKPPGFHVIFLPFLDDFRQIPDRRIATETSRSAVDAAKDVINKLKLKRFVPVENGAIQSCYRMVEAHALHRDTVALTLDETLPDLERMERKLGARSRIFTDEVYDQEYDPTAPPSKKARPPKDPAREKPKKQKEEAGVDQDGSVDMEKVVKAGSVNKLTVDVLKSWLKTQGVHVSNKKKAELIDEVLKLF